MAAAAAAPKGENFIFNLRELSGALGDLGTLLPLMLGAIAVAGLAPVPVIAGFAVFYIATAAYYRLPIPVQPMKAVAAVLLTAEISGAGLAASGVIIGIALLLIAAGELALTKRLLDCKPSCWPVIAVAAGVTVWLDPFWGLVAGSGGEIVRLAIVRTFRRRVPTR